jgi:hypothetical protein
MASTVRSGLIWTVNGWFIWPVASAVRSKEAMPACTARPKRSEVSHEHH